MSYSVLLAARNEEKSIGLALEAICNQSLEPSQILVGVNDSSDNTAKIARSFSGVDVFEYEAAGQIRTLNRLFEHLQEDHVVFTDADVVLFPRACEKIIDCLDDGELGVTTKSVAISQNKITEQPAFLSGRLYGINKPELDYLAQKYSVDIFPDHIIAGDTLIDRILTTANKPCKGLSTKGFLFEKQFNWSTLLQRELRIAKSSIQLEREFPQIIPYRSRSEKASFFVNRFKERYSEMLKTNPLLVPRKLMKYNLRFSLQFLQARYDISLENGSWKSPERNPELLKSALANPAIQQYF